MARPRKLDLNKRVVKGKDGLIIRNSTKETYDRVYKVCQLYGKGGKSVAECCESVGWKSTTVFYRAIVDYANCKEVANSVGLGLKHDPEIRPAKLAMPKIPPEKRFDIFDIIGLKKTWTDEEKFNAVKFMLEKLAKGVPVDHACALAGITFAKLQEWCKETPELIEKIRTGDAGLVDMMCSWFIVAGSTAAKQGKFGEILKGFEHRFPEKWGAVDRIDIVTKSEKGKEDVLSLSAKKAETIASSDTDFEIEEV